MTIIYMAYENQIKYRMDTIELNREAMGQRERERERERGWCKICERPQQHCCTSHVA